MRREGLVDPDEAELAGAGVAGGAEPGEDALAPSSEPRSPLPPTAVVVAGCPVEDGTTVAVSGASIDGPGSIRPALPSEPIPAPSADGAPAGPEAYGWLVEFGSLGDCGEGGSLLTPASEPGPEAGVGTADGPGSAFGAAVAAATSGPSEAATSDRSEAVVAARSGAAVGSGSGPGDGDWDWDGSGVTGDADSPAPAGDAGAPVAGVAGETEAEVGDEAATWGASGGEEASGEPTVSPTAEDAGRPEAARSPTPSAPAGDEAP